MWRHLRNGCSFRSVFFLLLYYHYLRVVFNLFLYCVHENFRIVFKSNKNTRQICLNVNYPPNGISLYRIPFWNDERPEAKKRRRQWISFVSRKRTKWNPSKSSVVCSAHFSSNDFVRKFTGFAEKTEERRHRNIGNPCCLSEGGEIYVKSWMTTCKMLRDFLVLLNLSRKPSVLQNFVGCHDLDLKSSDDTNTDRNLSNVLRRRIFHLERWRNRVKLAKNKVKLAKCRAQLKTRSSKYVLLLSEATSDLNYWLVLDFYRFRSWK